jgi:hypothetical protein
LARAVADRTATEASTAPSYSAGTCWRPWRGPDQRGYWPTLRNAW